MAENFTKKLESAGHKDIMAVAALIVFWIILCSGIFSNFSTHMYLNGQHVDGINSVWYTWWSSVIVSDPDLSLFECTYLNYPEGVTVLAQDVAFFHIFLAGLLSKFFGIIAAINLVFVSVILFSILATYIFIRQLTSSRFMACTYSMIPALYFPFMNNIVKPDVTFAAGEAEQALVEFMDVDISNYGFLMIALAMWIRLLKGGKRSQVLLTGIAIGLACISHMYYGFFIYIVIGLGMLAGLLKLAPAGTGSYKQSIQSFYALLIGSVMALAPLLPSIMDLADRGSHMNNYFNLNPINPRGAIIAVLVAVAASLTIIKRSKKLWFWIISTAALALFSVEFTFIDGQPYKMPTMMLKERIPFLWRLTFTDRYMWMAIIPFLTFVVGFVDNLREKFDHRRLVSWVIMIVSLPVSCTLVSQIINEPNYLPRLIPYPNAPMPKVPEFFHQVGRDKEQYALLSLERPDMDYQFLQHYYQVFHQKPLCGFGMVPLLYVENRKRSVLGRIEQRLVTRIDWTFEQLPSPKYLADQNIRYIVVFASYFKHWRDDFERIWYARYGRRIFEDDLIRVYDVNAAAAANPDESSKGPDKQLLTGPTF